jgi:hypothetical protein
MHIITVVLWDMSVLMKWRSYGSISGHEEHGHELSGSEHAVKIFHPTYQECSAYECFGY